MTDEVVPLMVETKDARRVAIKNFIFGWWCDVVVVFFAVPVFWSFFESVLVLSNSKL